jgi:hypothetical protein
LCVTRFPSETNAHICVQLTHIGISHSSYVQQTIPPSGNCSSPSRSCLDHLLRRIRNLTRTCLAIFSRRCLRS